VTGWSWRYKVRGNHGKLTITVLRRPANRLDAQLLESATVV